MNQSPSLRKRTAIISPSWTKIREAAVMTSLKNNSCSSAKKSSAPFSVFARSTAWLRLNTWRQTNKKILLSLNYWYLNHQSPRNRSFLLLITNPTLYQLFRSANHSMRAQKDNLLLTYRDQTNHGRLASMCPGGIGPTEVNFVMGSQAS